MIPFAMLLIEPYHLLQISVRTYFEVECCCSLRMQIKEFRGSFSYGAILSQTQLSTLVLAVPGGIGACVVVVR